MGIVDYRSGQGNAMLKTAGIAVLGWRQASNQAAAQYCSFMRTGLGAAMKK
ncbi:hypothetical protein [Janthinobacterium aquaticum]|uniref:hypothetical protein n=1 Tax=Janthinobacterium sp. FT58W TaxID=2654254 RepID=UPI00186B20C7|nr:hypothetical protein [Janthinobacterium sp. FT58W]